MKLTKTFALLAFIGAVAIAGFSNSAFADKGGKGNGKGAVHGKSESYLEKLKDIGGDDEDSDDDSDKKSKKGKKDRDGDKTASKGKKGGDDDSDHVIGKDEREIIQRFLKDEHEKFCPPGLAKKNNGCMPPGLVKKYKVGESLSGEVSLKDLPEKLLKSLLAPKKGQKYVQVDDDVLLIAEGTKMVLDAISAGQ